MAKDLISDLTEQTRHEMARDLPQLYRELRDNARANGDTSTLLKLIDMASKAVGLVKKDDQYANIPSINFVIGEGMRMRAEVIPPSEAKPEDNDVTDVESKPALPKPDGLQPLEEFLFLDPSAVEPTEQVEDPDKPKFDTCLSYSFGAE